MNEFSHLNEKRILVTGASGFIGKALVKKLKGLNLNFTEFKGEITEGIQKGEYDIIVHLAAKIPQTVSSEEEFTSVNVEGIKSILEYCKEKNAKIIYASTIGVYGNPKEKITENSEISPNINAYVQSKFQGEQLCRNYSEKYGINYNVLRISTVYGPGQEGEYLIPTLIKALKKNQIAELRDKNAFRDFLYIEDLINALLLSPKLNNSTINIASGKTYTVGEIVELIENISRKKLKVEYSNLRSNEIRGIRIDITKAKNMLNWIPKIDIEEGIKNILNYESLL